MAAAGVVRVLVLGGLRTAGAGVVAVSCSLAYDADDPWAVALTLFERSASRVPWVFARELLAAGLSVRTAPGGSVAVSPVDGKQGQAQVRVDLSNPVEGRHAVLLLPRMAVAAFLAASYRRVPAGSESSRVDWDPALRAWTAGGWAA
jgi:hypothetical protein